MPPDMRALEIFIADSAQLSGSVGVSNVTAAAVAHFCNLEGFPTPFSTPRFSKIMRGIKNTYSKAVKPKKPFSRTDIIRFMNVAREGDLMDWRAAFPMALCFQQLLRGAECFSLNGENVVRAVDSFRVVVETSKNHPEGFEFIVPINYAGPNCVVQFMEDYIRKMGIRLGNAKSFFACKVARTKGIWTPVSTVRVVNSTMRAGCKRMIVAAGMDPSKYATHSCKRGAALEALKAGLTGAQIQDLGRWSSASMVARYSSGDAGLRSTITEFFQP
jgi:integrase